MTPNWKHYKDWRLVNKWRAISKYPFSSLFKLFKIQLPPAPCDFYSNPLTYLYILDYLPIQKQGRRHHEEILVHSYSFFFISNRHKVQELFLILSVNHVKTHFHFIKLLPYPSFYPDTEPRELTVWVEPVLYQFLLVFQIPKDQLSVRRLM